MPPSWTAICAFCASVRYLNLAALAPPPPPGAGAGDDEDVAPPAPPPYFQLMVILDCFQLAASSLSLSTNAPMSNCFACASSFHLTRSSFSKLLRIGDGIPVPPAGFGKFVSVLCLWRVLELPRPLALPYGSGDCESESECALLFHCD